MQIQIRKSTISNNCSRAKRETISQSGIEKLEDRKLERLTAMISHGYLTSGDQTNGRSSSRQKEVKFAKAQFYTKTVADLKNQKPGPI